VQTHPERWPTADGDEIEIQRLAMPAGLSAGSPGNPRLLLLHGLEGTIQSHYVRGMLAQAQARAWNADVLIFRSCNGEMNRTPRLYHSGETTDLDLVVRRLVRENPDQPLLVAGFSLGGNVLLKWLGEQGDSAPSQLRAAAAISVPYDLEKGSRCIERGFSRLYARHFLRTLRQKATAKLAAHPRLFDRGALDRASTLFDFDDAVTAPVHGFRDASDYYARSSSIHHLSAIRRPTLLLSAYDDPFLPPAVLTAVAASAPANACLEVEFSPRGGHVGFVSGRNPFRATYYAELRATEFLARWATNGALPPHRSQPVPRRSRHR
jgi:predicted alpha/beta-fold hydrolase